MSSEPSADDLIARIDHEVDGIGGLITVLASGEDVVALAVSRPEVRRVREALVRLGIPPGRLVVQVIDEVLIPYPVTDPRLQRWMEHSDEASTVASGTREKAPESSAPFLLAALALPLLVPPLVYGAVALGAGLGVSGTTEALVGQLTGARPSLLGASILGLLPALLLLLAGRLLRRFAPGNHWRRAAGWGGLSGILLVLIWANFEAWPDFLPGRPFPGFPHGLELVIAPLFFAPVAMLLGGAFAGLVAHRRVAR